MFTAGVGGGDGGGGCSAKFAFAPPQNRRHIIPSQLCVPDLWVQSVLNGLILQFVRLKHTCFCFNWTRLRSVPQVGRRSSPFTSQPPHYLFGLTTRSPLLQPSNKQLPPLSFTPPPSPILNPTPLQPIRYSPPHPTPPPTLFPPAPIALPPTTTHSQP